MKKTIKTSALLAALMLAWVDSYAAGLGRLSVQSALGQPLRAEIELLSVSPDDLGGLTSKLASSEAYRQARMDRASALNALQFEVAQRANGQPVVRITSSAPIQEPFLDMLIELNWNTGRIVREYTLLLDPPLTKRSAADPAAVSTPTASVAPVVPAQQAQAVTAPGTNAAATRPEAPAIAEPRAASKPQRYGPVGTGETLRGIAAKVAVPGTTLEQKMLALYEGNRGAFIANNMNLLRRGAVLAVPGVDTVQTLSSPSQAAKTVREHNRAWQAARPAAEVPTAKADASADAAAGKLAPKAPAAAPAPAQQDVLKLSKGAPAAGKPDAKTQERLQTLEEELAAKARALKEAQERVSQLERTVQDMQQLLELKSKTPPPAEKAPPAKPAQPPAKPAQEEEPLPDLELPPPEAEAEKPAEPAAQPPAAAPKPAPAIASLPPPAAADEGESWISTFINNPLYIGGVLAAGLLSGLLWMMMVGNRRRQGLNKFEDSIMTGGEFKNSAIFNAANADKQTAGGAEGSMLLTDFSRLGLGAIDTHEVDPIAEAEVYMAYGRDSQAEEILKEALEKDSSRHEVALKLLEIYAARKDPLAFETTASELYAGLGGQDTPIWQRAASLGRAIDPQNPLYREAQREGYTVPEDAPPPAAAAKTAFNADDTAQLSSWAPEPGAPAAKPDADDFAFAMTDDTLSPGAGEQPSFAEVLAQPARPAKSPAAMDETVMLGSANEMLLDFDEPAAAPTPNLVDATIAAPAAPMDDGMSLDFEPAASPAITPATPEPAASDFAAADLSSLDAMLDMPSAASPAPAAADALPDTGVEDMSLSADDAVPTLDLSGIDLELTDAAEATDAVADALPEISLEAAAPADNALDFAPSLDFAVEEAGQESAPEAAPLPDFDAPADFDPAGVFAAPAETAFDAAPEPAAAAPSDEIDPALWEEVNTKLDLARAYLEMGDREGAREILQEVAQEGDGAQKSEAGKLLAEVG